MAQRFELKSGNSGDSKKERSNKIRDPRSRIILASLNKSKHGRYDLNSNRSPSKSSLDIKKRRKIKLASKDAKILLASPKRV